MFVRIGRNANNVWPTAKEMTLEEAAIAVTQDDDEDAFPCTLEQAKQALTDAKPGTLFNAEYGWTLVLVTDQAEPIRLGRKLFIAKAG